MKQTVLFLLLMFGISNLSAQEDTIRIKREFPQKGSINDSIRIDRDKLFTSPENSVSKYLQNDLPTFGNDKTSMDLGKSERKTIFNSPYSRFIVPTALVSYGITTQLSKSLKNLDTSTNHEVGEHITEKSSFDNYLQYSPAVAIYGLDFVGIKAKHNFRDRTLILGTSYLIMAGSVKILKSAINIERPDGSASNSFPSGHTATAFVGAHILFKEYKDVSPWIGVAGYAVATTTATMRVINKRHWVSDVITGAGIGILSAEVGYMLLPVWHRVLGIREQNKSLVVVPMVSPENLGVGMSYTF